MTERQSQSPSSLRRQNRVSYPKTISQRTTGHKPAFTSDVTEVIQKEQNRERDTTKPPESKIIRVRDEEGAEVWMSPYAPPDAPHEVDEAWKGCSLEFYRNGLIMCSIMFMLLAIFQVYTWILAKHYWPLHFLERIMDKQFYPGTYRVFSTWGKVILGTQQLLLAAASLSSALCFKNKMLWRYLTRIVYICVVNLAYIAFAIVFVIGIENQDVEDILTDAIDKYDYTVRHPQRVSKATNIGWDRLQQHEKCCGISGPDDWIQQRVVPGQVNKVLKLPMSCCMVFKLDIFNAYVWTPDGYVQDIEDCQLNLQLEDHWQDGCLLKLIEYIDKYCAGLSLLQIVTMLTVYTSAFFARKYFVALEHQRGNLDYDYTLPEALITTLCLWPCVKYEKDLDTGRYVMIGRLHFKYRRGTVAPELDAAPLGNVDLLDPELQAHESHGRDPVMDISAPQHSEVSARSTDSRTRVV